MNPTDQIDNARPEKSPDEALTGVESEQKPGTHLNLPPRSRHFGDRSEPSRIHKPIRRPKVRVIQRVEKLAPGLQMKRLP